MPSESEGSIHDRGGGKSSATDERLVPLGSTGDNSRQRYKAPRVCESSVGEWRERSSLGPTSDDKEMHQPCTAHAYQGITFSDAAPLRMRAIHLKRGATLSRLEHTRPPLLQRNTLKATYWLYKCFTYWLSRGFIPRRVPPAPTGSRAPLPRPP